MNDRGIASVPLSECDGHRVELDVLCHTPCPVLGRMMATDV